MPPKGDSPKALSNFITMRILKNIRKKVDAFERAQEAHNVEEMILNQLSEEEQRFLSNQAKLEEPDSLDEQAGTVLEDLSLKDLMKMYEDFRPRNN